jgi:hypothetical protein
LDLNTAYSSSVIHFNNLGKSYWDMVVPAYILCLMTNLFVAWVTYHLLDRVGLKLGKWIWDGKMIQLGNERTTQLKANVRSGLFVTKPKNASALPVKFAKAIFSATISAPGVTYRSVVGGSMERYHAVREGLHTLWTWRSPNVRTPVPEPRDPVILSQLYSTRWDSDISGDKEARRTYRLLQFQQWTFIFHIFWIPAFAFVWTWFHPSAFSDSLLSHIRRSERLILKSGSCRTLGLDN